MILTRKMQDNNGLARKMITEQKYRQTAEMN